MTMYLYISDLFKLKLISLMILILFILIINRTVVFFLDVIMFPANSITQSVSVEVMPLMSGYLPIPSLNIFRYYPSNSRQNTGKLKCNCKMIIILSIEYYHNRFHLFFTVIHYVSCSYPFLEIQDP